MCRNTVLGHRWKPVGEVKPYQLEYPEECACGAKRVGKPVIPLKYEYENEEDRHDAVNRASGVFGKF